ncbi:MAG: DNA primase [Planctomycetes bacterium]|nr:DNA primase [Planctomycetota bacterium]
MAGRLSEATIEEVQRASDIVEVISSYLPLKRSGKDYKACCPFHQEKTPSFYVSPSKQIFKCFGCGKGGSVFQFVMARENIAFPEAVRMLAERAGVRIEEPQERGGNDTGDGVDRTRVFKAVTWAARVFERLLADDSLGRPGREYLERRGFAAEMIERFHLGFVPDAWDTLVRAAAKRGVEPALLEAAGLVVPRNQGPGHYDRFRNRVMFPIYDALNRPIAFGGRTLGDDPAKYLNSPDTMIFNKSFNLYGLPAARDAMTESRRAIVVEGYTDCLMAHQVGLANVVATLGTSLTAGHVRLLKRYVDEVVLIFDGDLAGQNAADRALGVFLAEELGVRIVTLPENLDPCDFLAQGRKDEFAVLVDQSPDALEYKWRLVRQQFAESDTVRGRRRAVEAMLETIAAQPVWSQGGDSLRRDLVLARMAQVLGVSEQNLRERLTELSRRAAGQSRQYDQMEGEEAENPADMGISADLRSRAERLILQVLMAWPEQIAATGERLPSSRMAAATHRRLYEKLIELGRRLQSDGLLVLWGHLEDESVARLASDLAGEVPEEGPDREKLTTMLEDALATLNRLNEREELAKLRSQISTGESEEERRAALQKLQQLRQDRHGFLPPGMTAKQ